MTLPDSIRPNLDEPGEWGQIVASNVVSSIPGIRRQNDYFAVLVGKYHCDMVLGSQRLSKEGTNSGRTIREEITQFLGCFSLKRFV